VPEGRKPSWADRLLGKPPPFPGPRPEDTERRTGVVLWSTAILLVLLIFKAGFDTPGDLYSGWSSVVEDSLGDKLYWAVWGYLIYGLAPLLIIVFVLRDSPKNFGLRFYLTRKTALVYAAMVAAMMPVLFLASTRADFQRTYPLVNVGDDWLWTVVVFEAARTFRFVCLEFFFRGYLLFGLEGKLGNAAIAAATVPYGIIHFDKPFPEAMAAVLAGAVLGYLALRTRTILGGVIVHSSVGAAMDLLALWRKGLLF
jgi:membrane protease YdiL (CAAX protease family)